MSIVSMDGIVFNEPPTDRGSDFFGRWEVYPGLVLFTYRCGACGGIRVIPNSDITCDEAVNGMARSGVVIEDSRVRCQECAALDGTAEASGE